MKYKHTPLILTDGISHWPALKTWTSPRHLLSRSLDGSRLVPIELGESYVAEVWTQKLVSFSSFIHDHLLQETTPRGYLAQHDLLKQIPALRRDIMVPDYCYLDPPVSPPDEPKVGHIGTEEVHMNIWLGPGGTRSPLHNDPYENIFAQVVGYKYFRLYPPRMTEKVYPRGVEGGIEMGNTSQVELFLHVF
jgi:lysine-specific demethylase 8